MRHWARHTLAASLVRGRRDGSFLVERTTLLPALVMRSRVASMGVDIRADYDRVTAALDTPTLKLLDRKSARIAMPIFAQVFTETADSVPVDRFHHRIEALLGVLREHTHDVPSMSGRDLAMRWVREKWLFREHSTDDEVYRLTSHTKEALEYGGRVTRTNLNVSASRIGTLRQVVSDVANAVNPNREQRQRRLREQIDALGAELNRLESGGELATVTDAQLREQFANVVRELDGLPSDFRRVEETLHELRQAISREFREEEHSVGTVVDEYLVRAGSLLTDTPEGRAFAGALNLLRKEDWLQDFTQDLETISKHSLVRTMRPEDSRRLASAVSVITSGIEDILERRTHANSMLCDYIESYDHLGNREMENVLRDLEQQLRQWMQTARSRDTIDVDILLPALDIETLRLLTFDPASERVPELLAERHDEASNIASLDQLRSRGGPSVRRLRAHIGQHLESATEGMSAAVLFNALPSDLRRPVEALGVLHLMTSMGGEVEPGNRERVNTIRTDGTLRSFLIPRIVLHPATKEQARQPRDFQREHEPDGAIGTGAESEDRGDTL